MRSIHILLSILVPAALTFGLRALPFLLLNKRELPKRMESVSVRLSYGNYGYSCGILPKEYSREFPRFRII